MSRTRRVLNVQPNKQKDEHRLRNISMFIITTYKISSRCFRRAIHKSDLESTISPSKCWQIVSADANEESARQQFQRYDKMIKLSPWSEIPGNCWRKTLCPAEVNRAYRIELWVDRPEHIRPSNEITTPGLHNKISKISKKMYMFSPLTTLHSHNGRQFIWSNGNCHVVRISKFVGPRQNCLKQTYFLSHRQELINKSDRHTSSQFSDESLIEDGPPDSCE